eukprot:CAMPEP_0167741410 /NCGR_PEP_ID=MMETSP0110_2-20121227/844_1 /TAXON_ID=629695 /ORGANISM="Gymnochlora sp., Strain CCMP2014" /LENGTH=461 /DNA_ID=CAMNT_0007625465 /DNA_START=39 /DNA_END=1424 /DNA_ORIENTATION=-
MMCSRSLAPFLRLGKAVRSISTVGPRLGKVKDFLLADIGEGIAEVEVLEWTVQEGAKVEEFDELLKVQSDKAATEITSPFPGTVVQLMVKEGDMAQVGKPLCRIDVEGEEGETDEPAESKTSDAPSATQEVKGTKSEGPSVTAGGKILTSPAVRHIAKQHGIDLNLVPASGPKGRILKSDVLDFIKAGSSQGSTVESKSSAPPKKAAEPTSSPVTPIPTRPVESFSIEEDKVVPVRGLDRIMVQTMNAAHTVPTLLYSDEFNMCELIEARKMMKPVAAEMGIKLTYLPFIVKAASMALLSYPKLNTHVNEDCTEYTMKHAHNIGVAVSTQSGLLVPNVKNVQSKSLLEIAADLSELQALGHAGQLKKEHLSGGTFTISNIGSIGGTVCKPLIVVPEVAIAALGKFQELPRFNEAGEVHKATIMNVSLSADHRIIDGATVANFSNLWRDYLESPMKMLLHTK